MKKIEERGGVGGKGRERKGSEEKDKKGQGRAEHSGNFSNLVQLSYFFMEEQ